MEKREKKEKEILKEKERMWEREKMRLEREYQILISRVAEAIKNLVRRNRKDDKKEAL